MGLFVFADDLRELIAHPPGMNDSWNLAEGDQDEGDHFLLNFEVVLTVERVCLVKTAAV